MGILCGLFIAGFCFSTLTLWGLFVGIIGVIIIALSIAQIIKQKTIFCVVLGVGEKEVTAYRTTNKEIVEKMVQALNEAIVARG